MTTRSQPPQERRARLSAEDEKMLRDRASILAVNLRRALSVGGKSPNGGYAPEPVKMNQSDLSKSQSKDTDKDKDKDNRPPQRSTISLLLSADNRKVARAGDTGGAATPQRQSNPDLLTLCRIAEELRTTPAFLLMGPAEWRAILEAARRYAQDTDEELFNQIQVDSLNAIARSAEALARRFGQLQPDAAQSFLDNTLQERQAQGLDMDEQDLAQIRKRANDLTEIAENRRRAVMVNAALATGRDDSQPFTLRVKQESRLLTLIGGLVGCSLIKEKDINHHHEY